jgi:flagellar basal-body rod modification protein FlgD
MSTPVTSSTNANNYTNSSGVASTVNSDGTANTNNQTVSTNEFLQLLITQLQNQDPTQPVDQTQTLTQLAQFSELQQQTNLNTTETQNGLYSQMSENVGLIGQTVTTAGTSTTPGVTGVVSGVTITNGTPYLNINGQSVDASTVTQIQ